jgi:hypothetical protein
MYCPNCEAEYQAGITVCKDCGIALVDQLTPETALHDKSDADMVLLASFKFSGEAQMLQELLEKNGIPSYVQGATDTIAIPSGFNDASLFVDERDLEKARVLYKDYFESEIVMPDDEGDEEGEETV